MLMFCATPLTWIMIGILVYEMCTTGAADDAWKEITPLFSDNDSFICEYFCYTPSNDTNDYFPPVFPDPCAPTDLLSSIITSQGETSAQVFWAEPLATDKNGEIPRIEQVIGDTNGSYFNGSADGRRYDIVYLATDKERMRDSCHFVFKVYDEVNCSAPAAIENGHYQCTNGTMPGSSCTYRCIEGYVMIGDANVVCQSGNQSFPVWSPVPRCEVVHCIAPFIPENGNIHCNDPSFAYQSVCFVTCKSGFTAEGPIYMTCLADGFWSKPTTCTYSEPLAVHCISPQVFYTGPQQTSVAVIWQPPTSAAIVNNMVDMYQIEGPTPGDILDSGLYTVTYKMSSKKSNDSAECNVDLHIKVVTCDDPALIFNDSFMVHNCSLPTVILGTTCLISCRNNLQVEGNSSVTCVDNGLKQGLWNWGQSGELFCNETLPACPRNLNGPVNGKLFYKNDTSPEVIVRCDNGFDLQYEFSGNVSCENGEWVYDQIPECTVEKRPNYILEAEIYYYGQGCSENASEYYQEYKTTFNTEFEELITAECTENKTCKMSNVSIECVPTTHTRTRREQPENRHLNLMELLLDAFHSRFKRSVSHRFKISFTIKAEAVTNISHDSFDDNEDMVRQIWENNRKRMVSSVLGMLKVTGDFQVDSWDIVSYTTPTCEKNYILTGLQCKTCSIGNVLNYTMNKCQKCPSGTYKDKDGIAHCITCPEGTSTKNKGTVSVNYCKEYCRPGSASTDGLESCALCPQGYYQDEYEQTECKKCPTGTTTILANTSSINECTVMQTDKKCTTSSCNGHRCLNKGGNVSCVCSYGWSGESCEQPPDICADNICMNGAKCINRNDSYACECRENYKGVICQVKPVSGGWTEWSGWSECSATCDQGIRQRSRFCNNPSPSEYGDDCLGPTYETKVCVMDECLVCPKLNDRGNSYFECTDNPKLGLKTCSVRCQEGFVSIPGFEEFQELTCGLQTGLYWLPANVTAPCAERTYPRSLQLESSIEYVDKIPVQYYDTVKNYVLGELLHTDCFKSTTCIVEISLLEVSQPEATDEISDRTMLKLYMERSVSHDGNVHKQEEEKNKTGPAFVHLENAVRDMESTAAYLKNKTIDIFDVYINEPVRKTLKRSTDSFHADKGSLGIKGKVVCETGDVATGGICIRCPAGTYMVNESCHFCIKGTFQPEAGQSTCILCPPGLTTRTVGAYSKVYCEEEVAVIQVIADSEDSTLTVYGTIIGIVTGILGIIVSIITALKCWEKHTSDQ
ncbi:sushi, von Willebrand factor type A, EGF and pentraxin domain-containing protein 1-like [Mercenaria mercenaria]|uniref:sushi, von Willebrand factor type A, EGF and pentraxin domain-containing protein 1-like n=1 Tax=Mercenaria mercenaria TaxID=6596 RepID=UPI001E1D5F18|nr:sushi, von Willebrand factor type A, EGF and pentraxin domain-containing protein 1-like [Mercenaria mercenaria]